MINIGTLVTRVYTSRTQLPISDASVSIVQRTPDDKYSLLAVRVTDRNGRTMPAAIETPPLDESFAPGAPDAFTTVDIWVEHPSFQLMEIRNIQIFPGVKSIQEVPMLPLARSQSNFIHHSTIVITPQEL